MENLELLLLRPRPCQEVWHKDVINVVDQPVPGTLQAEPQGVPLVQTVQTADRRMTSQAQDCREQVNHVEQPGVPGRQAVSVSL